MLKLNSCKFKNTCLYKYNQILKRGIAFVNSIFSILLKNQWDKILLQLLFFHYNHVKVCTYWTTHRNTSWSVPSLSRWISHHHLTRDTTALPYTCHSVKVADTSIEEHIRSWGCIVRSHCHVTGVDIISGSTWNLAI